MAGRSKANPDWFSNRTKKIIKDLEQGKGLLRRTIPGTRAAGILAPPDHQHVDLERQADPKQAAFRGGGWAQQLHPPPIVRAAQITKEIYAYPASILPETSSKYAPTARVDPSMSTAITWESPLAVAVSVIRRTGPQASGPP